MKTVKESARNRPEMEYPLDAQPSTSNYITHWQLSALPEKKKLI